MKLSIVIPAYNEEKRIENTLISYYDYFNRIYSKDFEIFVVINGSNDNTIGVVDKISRQYKQIKYVNVSGKIGKGGAIIEGFKRVNGVITKKSPEELFDNIVLSHVFPFNISALVI